MPPFHSLPVRVKNQFIIECRRSEEAKNQRAALLTTTTTLSLSRGLLSGRRVGLNVNVEVNVNVNEKASVEVELVGNLASGTSG